VPEDAAQSTVPEDGTATQDGATPVPSAPSGGGGNLAERLDDVIRRQRELLREVEALRDAVRSGG
jgi:hypothetical protein